VCPENILPEGMKPLLHHSCRSGFATENIIIFEKKHAHGHLL
jgi:hypothetical protein